MTCVSFLSLRNRRMYQHALVAAYQTDFYTGNHCRAGTQTLHYVGHRKINLGTKNLQVLLERDKMFFFLQMLTTSEKVET